MSIPLNEAIARARYPIPSDVVEGALNRFRNEVILERDKIEPDSMTLGAQRYFMQHYFPTVAALKVEHGIPGNFDQWVAFSVAGFEEAARVYRRDQVDPPGPPPPPPPTDPVAIVAAALAKFPGHEQRPEMLKETARNFNLAGVDSGGRGAFGVLHKTEGNHCGGYSCDIICAGQGFDQQGQWDVLIDESVPTFSGPLTGPGGARIDVCEIPAPPALSRLSIQGTRFMRDGAPVFLAGLSSFDLSVEWQRNNDIRWFDYLVAFAAGMPTDVVPYARLIVSSAFRSGSTPEEGLLWLPDTINALHSRRIYAEVCFADSAVYELTEDQILANVAAASHICAPFPNVVGIEGTNEIDHDTVSGAFNDASFRRAVVQAVHAVSSTLVSPGSSHGGGEPRYDEGNYLTHHAARGVSPEDNAAVMATAQAQTGKPVLDDEPIGFAEDRRPGSRENDPEIAFRQVRAARNAGLAGTLLHLDAGPWVDVDMLGPIQRAATQRFKDGLSN